MAKIAFLGLGAMGSRMARHLIDPHQITVHNRSPGRAGPLIEAGARWAQTPREAAQGAQIVISVVTDDAASERLWLEPERGALAGLSPGALAIEASTVTPAWVHRLSEAIAARGSRLLDAPVVGSTPQADAGALAFLVGGAADDLAEASGPLGRMGSKILHVGPQGHGAILKLVVNALFAGQVALLAELLGAVEAQGIAPATAGRVLAELPVTSPAAAAVAGLMIAGDHQPRFPAALAAKDLRYAGTLGHLPVTAAVLERLEAAVAAGLGAQNLTAVALLGR